MLSLFHKRQPPAPEPGFLVATALATDPGCHRANNQDSGGVFRASAAPLGAYTLLIVADGMGGHQGGEVASRLAVETVSSASLSAADPHRALERAFDQANREINNRAMRQRELTGMGTTCTALLLAGGLAYAAHVGDSRLYLIRRGGIYQLTEDHSAVMQLVRDGYLTIEAARHHEDRNIILRALGTRKQVETSLWSRPMPAKPGDCFLLCSDGLYEPVDDAEIRDIATSLAPEAACQSLIALARERGGYDNITVAIAQVAPLEATTAAPTLRETREVGGIR
jgi:protein phosphatase